MIEAGRVTVDGVVVMEPGHRVDPGSSAVAVDGAVVGDRERRRTIMMYKPAGVLSAVSDSFGGKTVADLIRGSVRERLVPVGRLDKDSEGLLLMSNDGGFVLRMTHPRFGHEKTYVVRAAGRWSEEKLRVLRSPVTMPEDGYVTRPARVRVLAGPVANVTTLEFKLGEGRKRQIRRLCSAAHLVVLSLKRTAVGALELPPDMKPGEWRDVGEAEMAMAESAGRGR